MGESEIVVMGLAMLISIIIYLACGIIMLKSKEIDEKKRKSFGWLLLVMSVVNFVLFNAFPLRLVKPAELVSLILFFAIPFGEGMALLVLKEVSGKLKKVLGWLLILLFLSWLAMAVIS